VPVIDTTGVAADPITVDRVACYGRFFFAYAAEPGAVGEKVQAWTARPAATPADALAAVLDDLGVSAGRAGVDEGNCVPATWQRLQERLGHFSLVPAYQLFRRARMVKAPDEVAALERAAQIAEAGIASVLAALRPGVTEIEAAEAYEHEVLRRGASPYFTVVTIGERAALADVYPSNRALRPGELVRFDLGCVWRGYRSDISRTAVHGAPSDKQARSYGAVLAGERAAIERMKPGVRVAEIFDTAVRVTRAHGLPHYQRHHVGHGIGLEPYDPPTITEGNETVLEAGMVFCVETPYYEHGWGGVQVEDAVEITASGPRLLTPSRADLIVVG
jgi:Xaa-Pro aminopeptidase